MSRHTAARAACQPAHPPIRPSRRPGTPFRLAPAARIAQLAFAAGALAVAGWQPAQAQAPAASAAATRAAEAPRRYDIPAGPLSAVLARFASESGVLVAGAGELAQDKRSPGVPGELSAQAARAFGDGGRVFATHAELADALEAELHAGVAVLVKGSRSSAMDRIVAALVQREAGRTGENMGAA